MTWSKKLFVPRAYTLASNFLMFSRNTISGRWTRMYPSTPLRVGIVLSRLVSSYSMSRLKISSRSSSGKPDRPVVLSALASLQLKPLARMSTSGLSCPACRTLQYQAAKCATDEAAARRAVGPRTIPHPELEIYWRILRLRTDLLGAEVATSPALLPIQLRALQYAIR